MPCLLARQSKISVWDAPRQRSEEEEQEEEQRDVKVSNQRFCERISSSSADGGTGSWISPRCTRSYRVLRVGAVVDQTCILSFLALLLHLFLLSSVIHLPS